MDPRTATQLTRLGRITDFRSHAEPGAHLGDVIGRQVPLATSRADIVSAIAGANDLLAPRCDK
ncbi:MAG TPA: hypothetical protein VFI46_05345 [Jiangellaceae bacterium]|nr:hypothetical protein [Jiangellaceae bacterium]